MSAALHNVIFPGAEGANSTRPLTARATSHELVAPGGPLNEAGMVARRVVAVELIVHAA
jgi:hypothetical protein